jgi:hypothetical protein
MPPTALPAPLATTCILPNAMPTVHPSAVCSTPTTAAASAANRSALLASPHPSNAHPAPHQHTTSTPSTVPVASTAQRLTSSTGVSARLVSRHAHSVTPSSTPVSPASVTSLCCMDSACLSVPQGTTARHRFACSVQPAVLPVTSPFASSVRPTPIVSRAHV